MGYWEKRQEETYKAGEMQVNEYFKRLEKAFNQSKREIQSIINGFYYRYADENGVTYAQAQRQLSKMELGELRDFIRLAEQNIGKYSQEVNNLSIKVRVTRYEALEKQLDTVLQQLYAGTYQEDAQRTMQDIYEDSYYRTWYQIDQYRGFHAEFAQVDPHAVEQLIMYPFNGANFSTRIWKQKDHLQSQLMESLTTILIQGKHPETLAADLAKKMQTKKFEAYRLLHTESSFLISQAAHEAYKEDGVEEYQILATLDSRTCGICGEQDKKIYKTSEAVVGVNMPPFHCFCRCTDTPYYSDMDLSDMSRTARDPVTGEYITVPENMTYEEWMQTYAQDGIMEDNTDEWPSEAKEELLQDERVMATRKKETAVVYDGNGNFLFQKRGTEKEVTFTLAETGRLKGTVISHNHPSGRSFSAADFWLLKRSKAVELRAVVDDGVYYIRPPKKWSKEIDTFYKLEQERNKIRMSVAEHYQNLYIQGLVDKVQRAKLTADETNRIFAERYGMEYGKEAYED